MPTHGSRRTVRNPRTECGLCWGSTRGEAVFGGSTPLERPRCAALSRLRGPHGTADLLHGSVQPLGFRHDPGLVHLEHERRGLHPGPVARRQIGHPVAEGILPGAMGRREDHETTGPRDYGTTGPRDYKTTRPRDYGTTGPRDYGTTGPRDHKTTGPRDYGTTGPRD